MYKLTDFDYKIPQDQIAQQPLKERDESRLLIYNRHKKTIEHKHFHQIIDYLERDDLLVFNDTRVLPARLYGRKESGGQVEILIINEVEPYKWNVLLKSSTKPKPGLKIIFGIDTMTGTVINYPEKGKCLISFQKGEHPFSSQKEFMDTLDKLGIPPLPPYIKREKEHNDCYLQDKERYQTVFAKNSGAIAAPTAGLHFTPELINKIRNKGVKTAFVTLHVGLGTFKPIKTDDYREHRMDSEYYEVSEAEAETINQARKEGKRIIGVGTTACRVLETIGSREDAIKPCSGWTNLFIYPSYKFKTVNSIITNFHQPKTTLLLLVSAFAGRENILNTYKEALDKGYRFFSYGDSMLIV